MEELFQRPGRVKVTDDHLAAMRNMAKERLYPYKAPEWAEKLKEKPSSKIDMCQKNTPIQRWCLPDIPDHFEIYIKRDDLTGSTFSGHKIRKIEFHLADALEKNYTTLIGVGSSGSNYCRTIAVAGRELGFHVHLVQYTMAGAHIHLVQVDEITDVMAGKPKLPDDIQIVRQSAYILPINPGGDGDTGIYAYIDTFQELVNQGVTANFTDLVLTCGSTSATVAFIIGNYMTGGKLRFCNGTNGRLHYYDYGQRNRTQQTRWKDQSLKFQREMEKLARLFSKARVINADIQCLHSLHGLSVRCNKEEYKVIITNLLRKYGFFDVIDSQVDFEDLISIVEESREPKYGKFYAEHVDFVRLAAASTGIFLDPVYTGKTANHMVKMIRTSPNSFKGKKILYYNTGSVFGTLNEDLLHIMKKETGMDLDSPQCTTNALAERHLDPTNI